MRSANKRVLVIPWLLTGIGIILFVSVVVLLFSTDGSNNMGENEEGRIICNIHMKNPRNDNLGKSNYPQGRYLEQWDDETVALRPDPYNISQIICSGESIKSKRRLSSWIWAWGQFIDHNIVKTEKDIDDPSRSRYELDGRGRRQQINSISSFLDGDALYGQTLENENKLRSFENGRLRCSFVDSLGSDELLPLNDDGQWYLAGDDRVNENIVLTSVHTLLLREHNYWAKKLKEEGEKLDQEIFEQAKRIVVAEIQAITYNEFLPALLGDSACEKWNFCPSDKRVVAELPCYDKDVDPRIYLEFSTAAFRLGHTMVNDRIYLVNCESGTRTGDIILSDAYFQLSTEGQLWNHGIDEIILGLSRQCAEEVDTFVVDSLRVHLFANLDLAALNIMRGRDHTLPGYDNLRRHFGTRKSELCTFCSDKFVHLYVDVEGGVDPWIGLMCENHEEGASVGHTAYEIIADQFNRIRIGDPFFYEFDRHLRDRYQHTKLSDLVKRNTRIAHHHISEHQFFSHQ